MIPTPEQFRILKILAEGRTQEMMDRPLRSVEQLRLLGWAKDGQQFSTRQGRAREVLLTDAGRAALAAYREKGE